MPPNRSPLQDAFDPEIFRAQGHRLVDQLADYLSQVSGGAVLPWAEPERRMAEWPADFPEHSQPEGTLDALFARVLAQSNHLHHPRYVGHQVTAPLPVAALCEMVAALLNNGMAVYEMGPVSTAMEQGLVGWLAQQLGLGQRADGVLTNPLTRDQGLDALIDAVRAAGQGPVGPAVPPAST